MLFQNLYEDILVCQKLKTKHENPLINSVCVCVYIYIYIFILLEDTTTWNE